MQHEQSKIFTYQTRLHIETNEQAALDAMAELMGRVERSLFADIQRGKKTNELKSAYLIKFKITARQFNSIRIALEGKIDSIKECAHLQIKEIENRAITLKEKIQKLEKRKQNPQAVHQKKRRLSTLIHKLNQLKQDVTQQVTRLCFGSKKLFYKQFYLKENGYSTFEEWHQDWQKARSQSFFLVGSKDETSGNQSCKATIAEDGNLTLRLRLPDALHNTYGKSLLIPNVRFNYGHDVILASLRHCQARQSFPTEKNSYGTAISYRFIKDEKGWRIFVSTVSIKPPISTRKELGVLGVDINTDHIAVAETDRFGNPIEHKIIPLVTYGKTKAQAKALIGDVVKELVTWAKNSQKPIVLEKLDFQKKKIDLHETNIPKAARMLSSFAYSAIIEMIKARSYRFSVEVKEVNPAYTSTIGRVQFATRYGLSIHISAALVIGRRALNLSERLPRLGNKIPDGKGGHVALSLPARNRDKHVWTLWRQVRKKLSVVSAAQVRAVKRSSSRRKFACCDGCDPPGFVREIRTHEFVNSTA